MTRTSLRCCAASELDQLSDHRSPEEALRSIFQRPPSPYYSCFWSEDSNYGKSILIFTQAGRGKYGDKLAAYIDAYGLGTVTINPPVLNINTGRRVKMFIWNLNQRAVERWREEHNLNDPQN